MLFCSRDQKSLTLIACLSEVVLIKSSLERFNFFVNSLKTSEISFLDLAKSYEDVGVSVVIFTDIDKDGVLEGINIKQLKELISSTSLKVISSGGVSSLENLKKIKEIKSKNLIGVISGRAIYEEKFCVKEAVELIEGK